MPDAFTYERADLLSKEASQEKINYEMLFDSLGDR